ncbi:MAG TPA: hypothetical protein VK618_01435, partial [Flavitalea sp.]|nr:hypothetical protein [Flavitalea sp.]
MEKSRGEMMNSKFMRYFFLLMVLAFFTVDLSGQITRTPDKVVNKPRLFTKTINQKQDNSLPAIGDDLIQQRPYVSRRRGLGIVLF